MSAPEPFSDPRPRPAQDLPGIPACALRPASPAVGRPAVHPAALCKKMAGSVAESDAVVVSVAGHTPGAPFPRPRTPCFLLQLRRRELRPSPAPQRGKAPRYLLVGATVRGQRGEAEGMPVAGGPLAWRWGVGGGQRRGVTDSPLRALQSPARCMHVARVRVCVCECVQTRAPRPPPTSRGFPLGNGSVPAVPERS